MSRDCTKYFGASRAALFHWATLSTTDMLIRDFEITSGVLWNSSFSRYCKGKKQKHSIRQGVVILALDQRSGSIITHFWDLRRELPVPLLYQGTEAPTRSPQRCYTGHMRKCVSRGASASLQGCSINMIHQSTSLKKVPKWMKRDTGAWYYEAIAAAWQRLLGCGES